MKKTSEQVDLEMRRVTNNDQIFNALTEYYKKAYSPNIEREHIFLALFLILADSNELEGPGDLWALDLHYDKAKSLLSTFDFNEVLMKFETSDEIIPRNLLMQYKVLVKSKGLIWVVHKNDIDPFPSNPHAHLIDNNIKLDLSNGKCYRKRDFIYSISKKDLLSMRDKLRDKKFLLPVLDI